jgi:hypothetical protein
MPEEDKRGSRTPYAKAKGGRGRVVIPPNLNPPPSSAAPSVTNSPQVQKGGPWHPSRCRRPVDTSPFATTAYVRRGGRRNGGLCGRWWLSREPELATRTQALALALAPMKEIPPSPSPAPAPAPSRGGRGLIGWLGGPWHLGRLGVPVDERLA